MVQNDCYWCLHCSTSGFRYSVSVHSRCSEYLQLNLSILRSIVVHVLGLVFEQFCGNISATRGLLCVSTIASHFQLICLFHTTEFTGSLPHSLSDKAVRSLCAIHNRWASLWMITCFCILHRIIRFLSK